MATIAEGGLFPPIIQSYLPAFSIEDILDDDFNISFNLSEYNSPDDIKSVHVSITRQSNYHSVFDPVNYIRGVYVTNFTATTGENEVNIPKSIINISEINYNEYYKVQVRLSKIAYDGSVKEELSDYLTSEGNLLNFSEWSTVCLIKFIAPPVIKLDGNGNSLSTLSDNVIDSSSLTISGVYEKADIDDVTVPEVLRNGGNDLEYLSSYTVKLFDNTNDELLFDSGILSVEINNPNSFIYSIPFYFENNSNIRLELTYVTNDLYTNEPYAYVIRPSYSANSWNLQDIVAESVGIDTVIGKVNITFEPKDDEVPIPAGSSLKIRRAWDKDEFARWETIWTKSISAATTAAISFDDFTIESGDLYKYEITFTNNDENYTIVEGPILSVFDNAFLTGEGTQLCVRFNNQINTYKRNLSDNIVNTIGSQYPFITRNGAMDYRSFSLSGTIAYEMDVEHQFSSRGAIYGDWISVYGSYFVNRFINQQNDRVTQRKFRELVMNYLYSDMPKLFRSTPEGNMLVRITDVTLTPNQQLARMIYDFSCTVTEIGDASLENLKLYKIQDFGD
jgi:hypothetical protein